MSDGGKEKTLLSNQKDHKDCCFSFAFCLFIMLLCQDQKLFSYFNIIIYKISKHFDFIFLNSAFKKFVSVSCDQEHFAYIIKLYIIKL